MADVVDKATRSRMMANIKSKNTKPELQIRKSLHALGYRFRLHSTQLPGKPDIILPKHNAVIFVDGCFWHGHDCHLFKLPGTRTEFWEQKITSNKSRDQEMREALNEMSWRILTVWECSLKGKYRIGLDKVIENIDTWLHSDSVSMEIRGKK